MLKKAAMFGLDARIALAIFAALSVISGAALYNAAQKANATKYHQFFESIMKASEAFYLDTGSPIQQYESVPNRVYSADLLNNRKNLDTWKGPYVKGVRASGDTGFFLDISYLDIQPWGTLILKKNQDWTTWARDCDIGGADCYEWISFQMNEDPEREWFLKNFEPMDKLIDNGDGPGTGKLRYVTGNGGADYYIYYRGYPRKRYI
jgi:type II secretory pathway pseudopilin PulG